MVRHRTQGLVGPPLRAGRRVPLLFYADNCSMFSISASGMHTLCSLLDLFCARSHMRVNMLPDKTQAIIFAVSDSVRLQLRSQVCFYIAGQPVPFDSQRRCLGCVVDERTGLRADFHPRVAQVAFRTFRCDASWIIWVLLVL